MAIHHSVLKEATLPKLQRRFGNSLKNSTFSSNPQARAPQSGVASGVPRVSEDNSSESRIIREGETSLGWCALLADKLEGKRAVLHLLPAQEVADLGGVGLVCGGRSVSRAEIWVGVGGVEAAAPAVGKTMGATSGVVDET
jgi:hypothetical protein